MGRGGAVALAAFIWAAGTPLCAEPSGYAAFIVDRRVAQELLRPDHPGRKALLDERDARLLVLCDWQVRGCRTVEDRSPEGINKVLVEQSRQRGGDKPGDVTLGQLSLSLKELYKMVADFRRQGGRVSGADRRLRIVLMSQPTLRAFDDSREYLTRFAPRRSCLLAEPIPNQLHIVAAPPDIEIALSVIIEGEQALTPGAEYAIAAMAGLRDDDANELTRHFAFLGQSRLACPGAGRRSRVPQPLTSTGECDLEYIEPTPLPACPPVPSVAEAPTSSAPPGANKGAQADPSVTRPAPTQAGSAPTAPPAGAASQPPVPPGTTPPEKSQPTATAPTGLPPQYQPQPPSGPPFPVASSGRPELRRNIMDLPIGLGKTSFNGSLVSRTHATGTGAEIVAAWSTTSAGAAIRVTPVIVQRDAPSVTVPTDLHAMESETALSRQTGAFEVILVVTAATTTCSEIPFQGALLITGPGVQATRTTVEGKLLACPGDTAFTLRAADFEVR